MAKKISQLTQATEVKSDDVTVIVQDGETKKLPLNMMVTKQDIENKKIAGLAKLDEIEATYENDTYTPTITVKNKSSVKVGEGDGVDYSANVMDGHVKSAILKGNTLVNSSEKLSTVTRNVTDWYVEEKLLDDIGKLKVNTVYTVLYRLENISGNHENYNGIGLGIGTNRFNKDIPNTKIVANKSGDWCKVKFQLTDSFIAENPTYTKMYIRPIKRGTTPVEGESITYTIKGFAILEGDYTVNAITFNELFEGIQSVKMPVLTTCGKNLLNLDNGYINGYSYGYIKFGSDDANDKYTLSLTDNDSSVDMTGIYFGFTGDGGTANNGVTWAMSNGVLTFNPNLKNNSYKYFSFYPKTQETFDKIKQRYYIQIEQGSVATPYEPYKSNILSCNEEVELRGIGDVKDTLDCLTGEVTERIGEVVFDGSENWIYEPSYTNDNVYGCYIGLHLLPQKPKPNNFNFANNMFPNITNNSYSQEGFATNPGVLSLRINKNKLDSNDVSGFKKYLQNHPVTLQYPLETESIKTVDLMPSGTHPSTTPYCWKNGHIQLSSSGLLPNLEYSVVTSRAGQINQNATMIVKNDKRIFDLEILLAGGLVNTTYQALTLQNQVETGLSKVSLNSETEPDYLLYHMIMKLIEEKAYKLDDLTEKVSVFYLYEKLSDEQFETIYSALYPFVEDEIVEEPVVEELPEVVEDEVIM